MELNELSCRFCLSTSSGTLGESLFCRLSPTIVTDLVLGLLGIEVHPSDQFLRMCLDCEKKLNGMYKLVCDLRNSDRVFKILLDEYRASQKPEDAKPNIEMVYMDVKILQTDFTEPPIEDDDFAESPCELEPIIKQESAASPASTVQEEDQAESLQEEPPEKEEEDFSFVDPPSSPDGSMASYASEIHDTAYVEDDEELGKMMIDGDEEDLSGAESDDGKRIRRKLLQKQQECYVCSHMANSGKSLEHHMLEHNFQLPYKCKECLMEMDDLIEINEHHQLHRFPFGCLFCEGTFTQQNDLQEHQKSCNGYRCSKCSRSYYTVRAFKSHKCARRKVKLGSFNKLLGWLGTRQKVKKYHKQCPFCFRELNTNNQLANHLHQEHPFLQIPMFACDICSKKWTSLETARRHRMSHKNGPPKRKETHFMEFKTAKHVCWCCSSHFANDAKLVEHLQEQHPEQVATLPRCEMCSKTFSCKARLEQHTKHSHGDKARFCCSFCGKNFSKRESLIRHEKIHQEGKIYRCEHCSEEFSFRPKFYKHMKISHAVMPKKKCKSRKEQQLDPQATSSSHDNSVYHEMTLNNIVPSVAAAPLYVPAANLVVPAYAGMALLPPSQPDNVIHHYNPYSR